MASEPSLESLKHTNELLKAELAKLEEIAQDLETEEKQSNIVSDPDEVKQIFDRFDADKNGQIDSTELTLLAASLGEVWDDQETAAAITHLDANGDKQISFDEFLAWWNMDDRVRTNKTQAKLNALRAKLAAKFISQGMPRMIRQLSQRQAKDDSKADDWVNHQLLLSIGQLPSPPKGHIRAALSFGKPNEALFKDYPGCGTVVQFDLKPLQGHSDADRVKAADTLGTWIASNHERLFKGKATHKVKAETASCTRVVFAVSVPDPMADAPKLNVDLASFMKPITFNIDFSNPLSDFLDSDSRVPGTLASMLKLKLELNVQFRKALAYAAFESGLPALKGSLWAAFLEQTRLAFCLGDFEEFLKAVKPPEGVDVIDEYKALRQAELRGALSMVDHTGVALPPDAVQLIQEQEEQQIQQLRAATALPFLQPSFYLRENFQAEFRQGFEQFIHTAVSADSGQGPASAEHFVSILRRNFSELTGFSLMTPSGMRLTVDINGWCPFGFLPDTYRG